MTSVRNVIAFHHLQNFILMFLFKNNFHLNVLLLRSYRIDNVCVEYGFHVRKVMDMGKMQIFML